VEKGQTLISIARQHGVSVSDLQKLNKIEDVKKLQVGQRLLLPNQKTP
jgi:LysM repeat protein